MTQVDSFKPVLLNVDIDLSSFTGSAPADGAIDPITIWKYMAIQYQTGTVANPTVNNGDVISINGISITFTTAGGLDLAGIIATINALTDDHHVIAQNDGSNHLQLIPEAWYENYSTLAPDSGGETSQGSIIDASAVVLAELGFNPPNVTYPNSAGVDTLADAEAKVRGNSRWQTLMKMLSYEATVVNIGGIRITGGGMDSAPTGISFTVAFQDFWQIYTYDELNNNALIKGIPAVIRMVARALITDRLEVRDVLNPAIMINATAVTEDQLINLEIGALSDNLTDAASVVTVTPIALTR